MYFSFFGLSSSQSTFALNKEGCTSVLEHSVYIAPSLDRIWKEHARSQISEHQHPSRGRADGFFLADLIRHAIATFENGAQGLI